MKTTLCSSLTLLTFILLAFVANSFAQGNTSPERMVRVVYFLPNDRRPQPDIDAKLDTLIKDVQQLYADEMERHGFGRKTFRIEIDGNGKALVHHVRGRFNDAYYQKHTLPKVKEDTKERFDWSKNIYLYAIDISTGLIGYGDAGGVSCGQGFSEAGGGYGIFSASGGCFVGDFARGLVAHELGHIFGLSHYFRNDAYIMSYGQYQNELSSCHAEWLNAHRYFNSGQTPTNNTETAIKMISSGASPPNTIRLRFEITDPDGLHQVLLLAEVTDEDPGYPSVLDCKSLSGESNIIEFVTSELAEGSATEVSLHVIDGHGYITHERIEINIASLLPQGKVVSIPDANLAAAIRGTLRLRPRSAITQRDMLRLTRLEAPKRQITNLTGLEHAVHLRYLDLWENQIRDITPLTGLTRLKRINIWNNQISSIPSLAGLTDLTDVDISNNSINDITLFAELTQLKGLSLGGNGITDISPLAGLTQLQNLWLWNNRISDLTPLTELTQLKGLYLWFNQITDLTPLIGLTNLTDLRLVDNQVNDLSPLAGLTQLQYLYLQRNHINDVRPLTELVVLKSLLLARNPILNGAALRTLLQKNPDLELDIDIPLDTPIVQAEFLSPSMYWIDTKNGTLHRTMGNKVENLVPSVQNATSLVVDMANEKLYWTEKTSNTTGKVQRATLDGTPIELVKDLTSVPLDIALDTVSSKLYLTNAWGKVQRLNFDGSNFEPNLIAGLESPTDCALDVAGGKIYWTETAGSLRRANLNGSEVETLATDLGTPQGITVANNKIYWTEQISGGVGKIQRADLNGENVEKVVTVGGTPHGIGIDIANRKLYWTNAVGGIQRAALNGGNIENLVTELTTPGDFALSPRAARVLVAESQRPPMYWIDAEVGTLYRLTGATVENIAPSVQNATSLTIDPVNSKLYWTRKTSDRTGKVQRANLDGTNVELVKDLTNVPHRIAIDTVNRKLYLTNSWGKIQRLNFNGSNFQPNLITDLNSPSSLVLDAAGGKLYWIEQTSDTTVKIQRANLNGSNVQLVKSLTRVPRDLAIDTVNDKLYLTNSWGKIQRLNVDGSNFQPNLITDLDSPEGIALDVSSRKIYWAEKSGRIRRTNLDGSNIEDIVTGLGAPSDIVLGTALTDTAIAAAPATVVVAPDETLLHQNYPNPFNPETWIPYQLAKPADVTLTIYAVNGQVVRRLALGHQPMGMYQNRSRAAYWDGKNEFGESVASGIYFYTFTAGDSMATRKMLIRK